MKTLAVVALAFAGLMVQPSSAKDLTAEENHDLAQSVIMFTSHYVARLVACDLGTGRLEITAATEVLSKEVGMGEVAAISDIYEATRQ